MPWVTQRDDPEGLLSTGTCGQIPRSLEATTRLRSTFDSEGEKGHLRKASWTQEIDLGSEGFQPGGQDVLPGFPEVPQSAETSSASGAKIGTTVWPSGAPCESDPSGGLSLGWVMGPGRNG